MQNICAILLVKNTFILGHVKGSSTAEGRCRPSGQEARSSEGAGANLGNSETRRQLGEIACRAHAEEERSYDVDCRELKREEIQVHEKCAIW